MPNRCVLILAATFREATDLSRERNLKHGEWRYLRGPEDLLGQSFGSQLLVTECWTDRYGRGQTHEMRQACRTREIVPEVVHCPGFREGPRI
jgi:hypothetical protein